MTSQMCDTASRTQEAELQRKEQAAKNKQFALGKLAYGRGLYPESVRLFEIALDKEGPFSKLGGEIQLWQALAYQVCSGSKIAGRDCMVLALVPPICLSLLILSTCLCAAYVTKLQRC